MSTMVTELVLSVVVGAAFRREVRAMPTCGLSINKQWFLLNTTVKTIQ